MSLTRFRRRAGAPTAIVTFACFAMTLSPARIARAAGGGQTETPAPPSAAANAPVETGTDPGASGAVQHPDATETAATPQLDTRDTATAQTNSPPDPDGTEQAGPPQQMDPSKSTAATTGSAAQTGPAVSPEALPTGADKSGVTSKAISVPKGSGSIKGMGESFSAQLSTGIATFSVPFALPAARGGAQPSLGLSYSSSGGYGAAGVGWSVGVPFIARQTDRGVPKYQDQADWNGEQDRFVFNGGQELVPDLHRGRERHVRRKANGRSVSGLGDRRAVLPAAGGGIVPALLLVGGPQDLARAGQERRHDGARGAARPAGLRERHRGQPGPVERDLPLAPGAAVRHVSRERRPVSLLPGGRLGVALGHLRHAAGVDRRGVAAVGVRAPHAPRLRAANRSDLQLAQRLEDGAEPAPRARGRGEQGVQ